MFMPLCKVQYRKKSKARYFLIKEDDYDDFLVQLSYRMSSNIVKGLVEKAYWNQHLMMNGMILYFG